MIIYKTNLAEKLFGYAISRDFIKYSSPFCDMIDDPELAVDFDLAINFNQGLNGNSESKRRFTETLVLSSGKIDPGTLQFWADKMWQYPTFESEIEYVNFTFYALDDLAASSDSNSFANRLKNALADCLNSPCNPFAQVSDSIGSLAQVETAMNSKTMFPVGDLSGTLKMVTTGVDKTIFNKIPEIFQGALTQLGEITTATLKDGMAALTNKLPQEKLLQMARGGSLRSENLGLPYTPDLKTFFDIGGAAENILASVAQDLGGCFGRAQHNTRYNPYSSSQNQSTPADIRGNNVNGVSYDQVPTGQSLGPTPPSNNDSLGIPAGSGSKSDPASTPETTVSEDAKKEKEWDGKPYVSTPLTLQFNGPLRYSCFGACLSPKRKMAIVDDVSGPNGDAQIMAGTTNIGDIITPSRAGHHDAVMIQNALEKKQYPAGACAGYATLYAQGEKENMDFETIKGKFNNGIAISLDLINQLAGPENKLTYSKVKQLQQSKKIWGLITYKKVFYGIQLVHILSDTSTPGVKFTPATFFGITDQFPGLTKGDAPLPTSQVTEYGSWKQIKYKTCHNAGDMEFRIGLGSRAEMAEQYAAKVGSRRLADVSNATVARQKVLDGRVSADTAKKS
jgi:hypothetical protein